MTSDVTKVLAVASAGGHWEQLMMLRPALGRHDVRYVTTRRDAALASGVADPLTLPDCNKDTPLRAAWCAIVALWLVLRLRPDVIVTTGAAPGFFCLLAGRLVGARTLWIDSVANSEELSLSGRLSRRFAHQCWTQWGHLADRQAVHFHGSVLGNGSAIALPKPRLLAVASAGGHWDELMLLRETLERYDVVFATTDHAHAAHFGLPDAHTLPDCNKDTPIRLILCVIAALTLVRRTRPDVVLTTGAAPGFFCLLAGRLLGARTLWIDSVANGEQLSLSGQFAADIAHECWTQWEHLAAPAGRPRFYGAVL